MTTMQSLAVAGRLMLAMVVSAAALLSAMMIYADKRMPEAPAPQAAPAGIERSIGDALANASATYGIAAPEVMFVDSSVPGYTRCTGGRCTIYLGRFIWTPHFTTHPESVGAIAVHEFGHALLQQRGENDNGMTTVASMIAAIGIMLFFLTKTWKEVLFGGLIVGVLFALTQLLAVFDLMPMVLWIIPTAGFIYIAQRGLKWRERWMTMGGMVLALAVYLVPAMGNHRNEYFADAVAACGYGGVSEIRDGLASVSPNRGWTREMASVLFDPMHPSLGRRYGRLEDLSESGKLGAVCQAIKAGADTRGVLALYGN